MTAADFASLLDARRTGAGKWMARCPAHEDRSPSLSITEGHEGMALLHCFAGCPLDAVLVALMVSRRDLFSGTPPTAQQLRQLTAERIQRDIQARAMRLRRGRLADRCRKLSAVVEALGKRLAYLPDGAVTENALTRLFHLAVDRQHEAEAELGATQ